MPRDAKDVERAVVDRITDGQAVLLVGDAEQEHTIPADTLPDGAEEGSVLIVTTGGDGLEIVGVEPTEAEERRTAMRARLDLLRDRSRRFGGTDEHRKP